MLLLWFRYRNPMYTCCCCCGSDMEIAVTINHVHMWTPADVSSPHRIMALLLTLNHWAVIGQSCSPMRMTKLTKASYTSLSHSSGYVCLYLIDWFFNVCATLCAELFNQLWKLASLLFGCDSDQLTGNVVFLSIDSNWVTSNSHSLVMRPGTLLFQASRNHLDNKTFEFKLKPIYSFDVH